MSKTTRATLALTRLGIKFALHAYDYDSSADRIGLQAAQALRITAVDLEEFGCIDGIVPEPKGGAHTDHETAATLLDEALQKHFNELTKMSTEELVASRYNKFRNMAQFLRAE